jgi:diguanylate cyclase (GGDEF)-like protein
LRYKTNYSLCTIDIDHFKYINDQYGHPTGDKALEKSAEIIKKEIRTNDQCGRIGGEEFSVLLIKTNKDEALIASEKIRTAIEKMTLSHKNKKISMTISVGIAAYPCTSENNETTTSTKDMIQRADTALYMAKQSGRNKCCLWGSSKPETA